MSPFRLAAFLLLCSAPFYAKDKPKAYNEISSENVTLEGKAYIDPAAIKQLVGSDLGGHYIVLQMTVTPKGAKPLDVNLSDFELFCEGDGDRTQPQSPAEIASGATLVLKRGDSHAGTLGEETGTTWSGIGFGGGIGRKKKQEGDGSDATTIKKGTEDNGLKEALSEKALPEKQTTQPVSGLLYFPMEKKKLKDLVLFYPTPEGGKLRLYFKNPK